MRLKELFYLVFKPGIKLFGSRHQIISIDDVGDVWWEEWMAPGKYSLDAHKLKQEIVALKQYVNEGDVVIDVGAHVGDSSLPMALAAGKTGVCFALEPNLATFKVLAMNASRNVPLCNIVPLPYAAATEDSNLIFEYGDPWLSNGGKHERSKWQHGSAFGIPVKGLNLCHYLENNPLFRSEKLSFIKVDCEGFDLDVLLSLKELIAVSRPVVKFEIMKRTDENRRKGFLDFFQTLRYQIFLLEDELTMRLSEIEPQEVMVKKSRNYLAIPS